MSTILIIDDDRYIRTMMRAELERVGYGVVESEDGDGALAAFRSEPCALAIVDIFLPGKDGWGTLRDLQAEAPGLPFVVVTASAPLELLRPGERGTLSLLADRVPHRILRKPFRLRGLPDVVDEVLSEAYAHKSRSA